MLIAHLMASPFLGGPERQVLGIAKHLPADYRSLFLSFAENGKARPLLEEAQADGWEAIELRENWPRWRRAAREIARLLQDRKVDVLCTSGYKPDVIGLVAARRASVPAVAIAHGWTAATWKVRLNETLDRWMMRRFDCVVSVSEAQAHNVALAGVDARRMATIPNAVDTTTGRDDPRAESAVRASLAAFFPLPPQTLVAAAGRLSPEKGCDVFVDMAARVAKSAPDVGFLLFGDGPLRETIVRDIASRGLQARCVLAGFRTDIASVLPNLDVFVLSSYTEGLPVVLLEAMRAGTAVAATRVGGVPEVIQDGTHGLIVPPGDGAALAAAVLRLVADKALRERLGAAGKRRVVDAFSCTLQAERYRELFDRLVAEASRPRSERSSKRL